MYVLGLNGDARREQDIVVRITALLAKLLDATR